MTGELRNLTVNLHISSEDLSYWMIDEAYMESCCSHKFANKRDLVVEEMEDTSKKLDKGNYPHYIRIKALIGFISGG